MSRAKAVLEIRAEAPQALDALMLADLWNAAWDDEMPTSARLLAWALEAQSPRSVAVWVASQNGQPLGFIIASHVADGVLGWVDALAVRPHAESAVVHSALLEAASGWLKAAGCVTVEIGGGVRSLCVADTSVGGGQSSE